MTAIMPVLIGALACLVFVLVARQVGWKREVRIYAVGLVVAALITLASLLSAAPLSRGSLLNPVALYSSRCAPYLG